MIYNAIVNCIETVKQRGLNFRAYSLPSVIFVIEIGDFPLHGHPHLRELLLQHHKSYLVSMQMNDEYRRFTTSFPFRYFWKLATKLGFKF